MRRAGLLLFFLAGGLTAALACGSDDTEPTPFTPGDASAPPDATAIGSLDGKVYFGGLEGHVYGLETRSW